MVTGVDYSKIDNIKNVLGGDSSQSGKAIKGLDAEFNNFLTLLTTQLKNQDPTQPMDTSQFTQQIVALSSVEQQVNTNSNLEKLISLFTTNQVNAAVGYIGKVVEAEGNKSMLGDNGAAFVYNLEKEATKVSVTIKDAQGNTVFTSNNGTKNAGRNLVTWDGTNSSTGEKLPNGAYSISVSAFDASNNPINAITKTIGLVTSLETKDGVTMLKLGDIELPLDKILNVSTPELAA